MKKTITPVLIVVLLIVAYFVWNKLDSTSALNESDVSEIEDMENIEILEGLEGFEGIEVGLVPIEDPGIEIPKLERNLVGLTENSYNRLQAVISSIKENHLDPNSWMEIGGLWQAGEDFEAAREAWEYAVVLSPNNIVSLINLGNLHTSYIIDLEKAEFWYNKALKVGPQNIVTYFKMAEMYLYGMKDRGKAIDIVEQGLKELPLDGSLQGLKDALESGAL